MSLPIRLALGTATTLLVLDGLGALIMAGLLSPAEGILALVAVLGSLLAERFRGENHPPAALQWAVGAGASVFALLDLLYLAESLLHGLVHLLVVLACYKLYVREAGRDFRDLFFLSFFMLVAASTLTAHLGFLVILVAFLVLGTWTFVLYHLLTETARYARGESARFAAPTLASSSLLSLSLVASALTVAFTLVFFFVIPRIGLAAITLGAKAAQKMSGFSDHVELGAFGPIQTDPTVVMRVRFPDGPPPAEVWDALRWRGMAFDRFTGDEWRVSRPERRALPRSYDGRFTLTAPRGGWILAQDIYLEPIGTDVIFAAPRLLSLSLPVRLAMVDQANSVSIAFSSARLRYVAYSEVGAVATAAVRGDGRGLPDEIRERYLQLPPLSPRVSALARQVTRQSRSPYEAALALTEHLRGTYRYTLDLRRETALPPVEEFLFVTRQGNCEYFAASLAVLLRELEIPARVVAGFQRGEWNSYGEYLVVRQRDAHSWVEAYFPGRGWVTLDPSPRAEVDAAFQTSRLSQMLDAIRMRWYRYIVNWSLADQIAIASTVRHQILDWRRGVSRVQAVVEWRTLGVWLLGAGVVAVVLLLTVRLRRGYARPGGVSSPGPRRSLRAYDQMLKRLARLALTPRPSETAREFAGRAALALPHFSAGLMEITRVFEGVRYGHREALPEEEQRLVALVKDLRIRQ